MPERGARETYMENEPSKPNYDHGTGGTRARNTYPLALIPFPLPRFPYPLSLTPCPEDVR